MLEKITKRVYVEAANVFCQMHKQFYVICVQSGLHFVYSAKDFEIHCKVIIHKKSPLGNTYTQQTQKNELILQATFCQE